jgi:hypothetical protein
MTVTYNTLKTYAYKAYTFCQHPMFILGFVSGLAAGSLLMPAATKIRA